MELHSYKDMAGLEKKNWWYVSRRKVIEAYSRRFADDAVPVALDMGCGVGSNYALLAARAKEVVGTDMSPEALVFSKSKGYSELVQTAAESTPFSPGRFDLILCADVLEHTDDQATVKEFHRLLATGGKLVITVPAFPSLWHENDDYSHHKRRYRKEELRKLFADNGFDVKVLDYWNMTFFPIVWISARLYKKKEGSATKNNLNTIPQWMNATITLWMSLERFVARFVPLPFGVSLVAVIEKKG